MPKTTTVTVMMTPKRAREIVKRVNSNVTEAGDLLLEYHDQEGWKAMGYGSFKEACEKEFPELYGGRAQVYRLMQQATVTANVSRIRDTHTPVPVSVSQHIGKLPASQQEEAFTEAGGDQATIKSAKASVEKRAPAKAAKKPAPVASDAKHQRAIDRIGHIIGKKVADSITNGILDKVTKKEAIFWAALKDSHMSDIETLVVGKRWKPSAAWKLVNKMVTVETKLQQLINLAIAGGGDWTGDVNGFRVTVKDIKRR